VSHFPDLILIITQTLLAVLARSLWWPKCTTFCVVTEGGESDKEFVLEGGGSDKES
jgi:hypothetical protein